MKTSGSVEDELLVRLYRWSREEWEREITGGYETLKRVSHPLAVRALRFLASLDEGEQREFSRAATRRFHPEAAAALSDDPTPGEKRILERWDSARCVRSPTEPVGTVLLAADRKALVEALKRELSFLGTREGLGGRAWRYEQQINGWTLRTFVDAGGRTEHVAYRQDFGAEGAPAIRSMSPLAWLGISSETAWSLSSTNEIESVAAAVGGLCRHFAAACGHFGRGLHPA